MKYSLSLILAGLLVSVLAACEPPPPASDAREQEAARAYHYSPFVVQVQDGLEFDRITFKDVGLGRERAEPNDPVLEVIAESLSYQMSYESPLHTPASVYYDATLVDPANHLMCSRKHIYVDLWRTTQRWGYSLWSGCGEDDNFAWKEVSRPDEAPDLASEVSPLTESITESIADAHDRGCYSKRC